MATKAPAIKGYRLVYRVPCLGSEEDQDKANWQALHAEVELQRLGVGTRMVGWYRENLVYAKTADMLAKEQEINAWATNVLNR